MSQTYEPELDQVQTHMLGLIVSIMNNYGLTEENITQQIKYLYEESNYPTDYSNEADNKDIEKNIIEYDLDYDSDSISSDVPVAVTPELSPVAIEPKTKTTFTFKRNQFASSWASDDEGDDDSIKLSKSTKDDKKIYVANRRLFRDALSSGTKICANYTDCTDDDCIRFHVKSEDLCPHAGRNNYCTESNCEKIVIKACRKGKRCSDPTCSFRH